VLDLRGARLGRRARASDASLSGAVFFLMFVEGGCVFLDACRGEDSTSTRVEGGLFLDARRGSFPSDTAGRACGKVVCAFCAPAGDQVAGDGIAEYVTLPDKRIPLTRGGVFGTVRVCRPCHFKAYGM